MPLQHYEEDEGSVEGFKPGELAEHPKDSRIGIVISVIENKRDFRETTYDVCIMWSPLAK